MVGEAYKIFPCDFQDHDISSQNQRNNMPYPIERKLVVAVSSSALFDLSESHAVFLQEGPKAYKKFQEDNLDKVLKKKRGCVSIYKTVPTDKHAIP